MKTIKHMAFGLLVGGGLLVAGMPVLVDNGATTCPAFR
jgi:hypothetical protein